MSANGGGDEAFVGTEDEYQVVFDAAPDGILVVDARGVIQDLNPRIVELFQYERDELLGREVETLVPERHRADHASYRDRYEASPHRRPMGIGMQLTGRRKDGTEFPVEISLSPAAGAAGSPVIAIVRDQTERVRLRRFGTRALRAAEDERRRLARELHDDTAQRLATVLLRLRVLAEGAEDGERRALEEIRDEIRETVDGVRRIARGLRPPALQDAGIVAAIRSHLLGIAEASGVDARLHTETSASKINRVLDPDQRLIVYRVVQEAASNAMRHSGSDRVDVRLELRGDRLVASVEDRGSGFDLSAVRNRGEGLGLVGMEERVTSIGGRLEIDSTLDRGTRVRMEIPIRIDEGEVSG